MRRLIATLTALFGLVLAFGLFTPVARAHMGAERFKLEKRVSVPPKGPRGQLEVRSLSGGREVRLLRGEGSDYVGEFEIRNTGRGPLTVNRVFVVDAEDDPRSPPGLVAQPEGGVRSAIPEGTSRRWSVTWHAAEARAQELYVLLVIDSDAAQPDAKVVDPPKILGIVAQRRVGLGRHGLLALSLLPMFVALLAFASRFVRALGGRVLRVAAVAVMVLEAAIATWLFAGFDRELGRRDGNDGLSFIDRFVIDRGSGIELSLGVDGLSIGVILAVVVVALACFVALASVDDARDRIGGGALLVGGVVLALSVQTTAIFVVAWALSALGAAIATREAAPRASAKIAVVGVLSTVLLGLATRWLASHAGGGTLFDGTESPSSYAFADLGRAHLASELAPVLGLPGYRAAWLLTFLGAASFLPLVPLHSWLGDLGASLAGERRSLSPVALTAALLPTLSGYAILRLCLLVQPDGARWGAESLPVVGVALMALGGLFAVAEPKLDRLGLHLTLTRGGLLLMLAFSLTPQGIEGASSLVTACALGSALFYLTAGTAIGRVRDASLARLGGFGRTAPALSVGLLVGALALGGPALPGLAGPLLGLVGAVGRNPVSSMAGVAALALAMVGVARAAAVVFGPRPTEWTGSKYLEPFGGALPDLRRADLAWAAPLFTLALLLALAPRLFVGPMDAVIRDLTPRLDPDGPTRVARAALPPGSREGDVRPS